MTLRWNISTRPGIQPKSANALSHPGYVMPVPKKQKKKSKQWYRARLEENARNTALCTIFVMIKFLKAMPLEIQVREEGKRWVRD
jgi:hypothetical protein